MSKGGRPIPDLLEMSEVLNKKKFLVTNDIGKAFDSDFLIVILEKIGLGNEFIEWKIMLQIY